MTPTQRRVVVVAGAVLVAASPNLMGFLGKWEGDGQNKVYADKLAGGLPTVCKGITHWVTSTPIIVGEVWSNAKCAAEEEAAVARVQTQLARCFALPPTQEVFDMASSHAWNLGAVATCGSGAMQAFNRGEWERGCQRLSRGDDGRVVWSFTSRMVNGRKVLTFRQGLANRRADETQTCLEALL